MVSEIRIYVEGGGDRSDGKTAIRQGFSELLRDLKQQARDKGIRWHIVACGSRNNAFDDFKTAIRRHPNAFNVLLVDSEAPVSSSPWEHLAQRDHWPKPDQVDDEHCHLMVQTMETWLITDVKTLSQFYGQQFNSNAIPRNSNVEEVEKQRVAEALEQATKLTQKGLYHKIRHGPELLKKLDVQKARACAPHLDRLFVVLQDKIAGKD